MNRAQRRKHQQEQRRLERKLRLGDELMSIVSLRYKDALLRMIKERG